MYLSGSHLQLRKSKNRSDPRRMLLFVALIIGGLFVVGLQQQGVVRPIGIPTPTATRNPVSYAEEGEAQFAAGRLDQAIAAYQAANALDPKNVDYWVALARIQIYNQQYADALQTAEKALLAGHNSAKAQAIYAWALDQNGQYDKAKAAILQAIALDAHYAPALAYYSEILNDTGNWSQGTEYAKQALALDPNSLDANRAMGWANESQGYYDRAIEYYNAARKINPNLIAIYLRLGVNYRALDPPDNDNAIAAFSKASTLNPEDPQPYLYLSTTYYRMDELGTSRQYLEQALAVAPTDPDIHGRMGFILFKLKNYEDAEPYLRRAVYGGDYEFTKLVGDKSEKMKVTVKPLALDATVEVKKYYYTLGNLMAYTGHCAPTEAPALLAQVLAKYPDDPTVIGSYDESLTICRDFTAGTTTPQPTPTATKPGRPQPTQPALTATPPP